MKSAAAPDRKLRIPLFHLTDLYHPPDDPDDHFDLATILALEEFDLRGVGLDASHRALKGEPDGYKIRCEPGFIPVAQLGYLTGRTIPVAMGCRTPLGHPEDRALDAPRPDQAAIHLLLQTLAESAEPVIISVVSSSRILTAAFNREPDLVRAKTRCVLLNAGSCGDGSEACEWNVLLDRAAFIGLWRSGLPIRWYPCSTQAGAFELGANERGTHWHATHEELFRDLPLPLKGWFGYSLSGNGRGDIIRALGDCGRAIPWTNLQAARRNLWSTASLVMAADRVLAQTAQGWRFRPAGEAGSLPTWPFRLDAIASTIDERGVITWQPARAGAQAATHALFRRKGGAAYGTAMTEALNALLRELPL